MKKILAIRNDRFGEFLLNIPAFRAIKESFPEAELHVVVSAPVMEIAEAIPLTDRVMVGPENRSSFCCDVAFIRRLRRERYDVALVLNPSSAAHRWVFFAGIPVRAGYARKQAFFLNRTIEDRKHLGFQHEVKSNLELAGLIGARTTDETLVLDVSSGLEQRVRERFSLPGRGEAIAVHPYTSDPVKQWPLDRFRKLIAGLAEKGRIIVVIGQPESWHSILDVKGVRGVLDLRGQTTLMELAAVFKQCGCLVSCDSGPVHLACSTGMRVVALFRNDMPGKTSTRWGPWGRGHAVVEASAIESISVAQVMRAIGVNGG